MRALDKHDPNASFVVQARQIAGIAHAGQTRRNGEPYITHPERVAQALRSGRVVDDEQIVASLHDVVEDTELTLDDLRKFGFSEIVIEAVDSVTRREGETYLDFTLRAKKNKIGRKVKIADIEDNLGGAKTQTREKYLLALWILNLGGDDRGRD